MNNVIKSAVVAATLALTTTVASAEALEIGGVRVGNPLDVSTWWDGSEHEMGETVAINFADPDFWFSIPNPAMHSKMHGSFTNPATYAQFFKLETYTNMMDVNVWMKWLEADTYAVLLDPQTYAYWAQPGAYGHLLNVDHYTQVVNPAAYSTLFTAAFDTVSMDIELPEMLKLSSWMGTADEAPAAAGPVVAPEGETASEG